MRIEVWKEMTGMHKLVPILRQVAGKGDIIREVGAILSALADRTDDLLGQLDKDSRKEEEADWMRKTMEAVADRIGNMEKWLERIEERKEKEDQARVEMPPYNPPPVLPKDILDPIREQMAKTFAMAVAATTYNAARNLQGHREAIERSEMHRKQVLIEGIKDDTAGSDKLNLQELVEKGNIRLDLMGSLTTDKPEGTVFVAAKRLKSGGVVLL